MCKKNKACWKNFKILFQTSICAIRTGEEFPGVTILSHWVAFYILLYILWTRTKMVAMVKPCKAQCLITLTDMKVYNLYYMGHWLSINVKVRISLQHSIPERTLPRIWLKHNEYKHFFDVGVVRFAWWSFLLLYNKTKSNSKFTLLLPTVRNPASMLSYLQLELYIMDFKQIKVSRHLPHSNPT